MGVLEKGPPKGRGQVTFGARNLFSKECWVTLSENLNGASCWLWQPHLEGNSSFNIQQIQAWKGTLKKEAAIC